MYRGKNVFIFAKFLANYLISFLKAIKINGTYLTGSPLNFLIWTFNFKWKVCRFVEHEKRWHDDCDKLKSKYWFKISPFHTHGSITNIEVTYWCCWTIDSFSPHPHFSLLLSFSPSLHPISQTQTHTHTHTHRIWSQSYQTFFFVKQRYSRFLILSLAILMYRQYFPMQQTLMLINENLKNEEIKVLEDWLLVKGGLESFLDSLRRLN